MKNEHTLYKLTDENCLTHGGMLWEVGKTNFAIGKGNELCTNSVLHAYTDPLLAVLLNPIHAGFENPRIFRVTGDIVADDGLKVGSKWQRVEHETDLPKTSIEVRATFAILCGLAVYHDPFWRVWAWNWLDGTDRTTYTAYAAYTANVAYAANDVYAAYAAYTANAATNAAAKATNATNATNAAYVAANAANAAYTANAAANAANAAANAANAANVNLVAIADMAFRLVADGI